MWKPKLDTPTMGPRQLQTGGGAMAHRRTMGGRKLLVISLALLVTAALLAGSVYVSNRVTGLRTEIARLESQREFLEAGSARLLSDWNSATAPKVITARARTELGLICPPMPDLVLVQVPQAGETVSTWRRLLDNVGGAGEAQAAMVSLAPRPTRAQGDS